MPHKCKKNVCRPPVLYVSEVNPHKKDQISIINFIISVLDKRTTSISENVVQTVKNNVGRNLKSLSLYFEM